MLATEIIIDGILNPSEWGDTLENNINYQVAPQTFNTQKDNFTYRIVTTDQGIYLGLTANIKRTLRIRTQENDKTFSNDHFQIMLDMNNNSSESYVFGVNHQGNYFDGKYDVNSELNLDWNNQWQYEAKLNSDNWIAEIFIPWRSMTFSIKNQNIFGLYISRFDESTNGTYASSPTNERMNNFFQQFSKLSTSVVNESIFEFFPYISANRDIVENKNNVSLGADFFWQPTKNQRLSATINPDFGQVESDELIVNFSAIESFFSEKRPFFSDNQSLFDVTAPESLTVVHTPRVGGKSYYDDSYNSELNSALKYTYSHSNYDVGILSSFEESTNDRAGRDFLSLRAQKSFNANILGVSVNHINTPSIDRKAIVLSSDFHYKLSESSELNAGIIQSRIDLTLNNINDIGWWVTGSSDIDDQHSHEFSLFTYGEDLQLNDIGYVKRVNRKQFEYEYEYQTSNINSTYIRDVTIGFETELKTNFQNEKLPHLIGTGIEIVTHNEFEYQASFELLSSGFDDLITRSNNSLWLPSSYNIEFGVSSPEYLWGKYSTVLYLGTEGWKGKFYNINGSIEQQINDKLNVSVSVSQYNSDSWIEWDESNSIDEFNFTEQGIELNLDYQISDNQELRIKLAAIIGKAKNLSHYVIENNGLAKPQEKSDNFAFSENAFQLRYKYSLSKLTAFYLSYGFGGEYEDEIAKFGKRNLYKHAFKEKAAHNIFAKLRLSY
ncbi:DUF5916 domain-containing protein [Colwellia sp. Arc7-635]|uniref:DUF5916 domain-containing protein n=1 Tax=Colwellia sp. Arc7-635 TaxID=2497879 RepID=UPI001F496AA8|nr:DUF5916 domain-containing protein [Colwellia sp. Arc7-635]